MNNYMKHLFLKAILLASSKPTLFEKIGYLWSLFVHFAPVAFILDGLGIWFQDNHQFASFLIFCLVINMLVGIRYHRKFRSFNWKEFWVKNSEMFVVLIVVYTLLEMLRITAGPGLAGEAFKVVIQITTLFYPISKSLKNIYILSGKKYPPEFIMERLYKFEKEGNVKDLFGNNENKNNHNIE